MGEIERIDKILKNIKEGIEVKLEKSRNIDISVLWPRLIEENLRGKSYVLFEKEGDLYIKVESGCFLSLLRMKKNQIIRKLKESGFNYKDIKFII